MKPSRILLFLISNFFFLQNVYTQQQFYTEVNSGVTSNLTSAWQINLFPIRVFVCGNGGVVLKTTNDGSTWVNVGANGIPASVNLTSISTLYDTTIITVGKSGTITYAYRSTNGGANWTQVFSQANGNLDAVYMRAGGTGWMCGDPVNGRWSLWKTTNGGATWDSTGLYIPQNGSERGFPNSLAIRISTIWFGTNNSRLYRSTNNGVNWAAVSTGPQVYSSAVWVYLDTSQYTFVEFGGTNPYYSTNGGTNWTLQTCPDTGKFVGFCPGYYGVYDYQPMAMYAVRNNNKIYFSNGYNSFLAEYTAPAGVYNYMARDADQYYWGTSWAVRNNGGITRIFLFRGGSVRRISSEIPASFALEQNYPNPFNPITVIRCQLPAASKVSIVIYDILGREIEMLVNEQLKAGTYDVEWDATNYPSGIYFYTLKTESFSQTKRMVLLK